MPAPSGKPEAAAVDAVVRRYERRSCDLPCVVSLDGPSREAVRLSRSLWPSGEVPGRVIDLSPGGLGIRLGVFLPKRATLRVRIARPGATPGPTGEIDDALLDAVCTVQRVEMIDRTPNYEIGAAFERAMDDDAFGAVAAALRGSAPDA